MTSSLLLLAHTCALFLFLWIGEAKVEQVHISYTGQPDQMLVVWVSSDRDARSIVKYGHSDEGALSLKGKGRGEGGKGRRGKGRRR